jgi:erythromycin esterase-like protein
MEKSETVKLYAERDAISQGDHYLSHLLAMTAEGLHSKSDIAAELAHRDIQIDALAAQVRELEKENEGLRYIGKEVEQHLCRILGEPYPNPGGEWKLAGASSLCESVEEALTTAREEALEEAAKVVDDHYWDSLTGSAHGASLAKMIRALKPTTEAGGGETK